MFQKNEADSYRHSMIDCQKEIDNLYQENIKIKQQKEDQKMNKNKIWQLGNRSYRSDLRIRGLRRY